MDTDSDKISAPVGVRVGYRSPLPLSRVPGETKTVVLRIPVSDLAWYNPAAKQWEVEKRCW